MKIEISQEEQQLLLSALNQWVKNAQNALETASQVLPLAIRLSRLTDVAADQEPVSD